MGTPESHDTIKGSLAVLEAAELVSGNVHFFTLCDLVVNEDTVVEEVESLVLLNRGDLIERQFLHQISCGYGLTYSLLLDTEDIGTKAEVVLREEKATVVSNNVA